MQCIQVGQHMQKTVNPELKRLLVIPQEDGILFKGHRLIVPKSERQSILDILHTGYYGIDKMTLRARESAFWPGISNANRTLTETCTVCQENSQLKEIQQQT